MKKKGSFLSLEGNLINFAKYIYKSSKSWYNKYAKPTEYFSKGYSYLYGVIITFCCRVNNKFVKNANFY